MRPDTATKLRELRRVLQEGDPACFNMTGWATDPIGWAQRDPWFRAQGLRRSRQQCPYYEDAAGNRHSNWQAVQRFFGLPMPIAVWLFDAARYVPADAITPAAVIARIDVYLAANPVHEEPQCGHSPE